MGGGVGGEEQERGTGGGGVFLLFFFFLFLCFYFLKIGPDRTAQIKEVVTSRALFLCVDAPPPSSPQDSEASGGKTNQLEREYLGESFLRERRRGGRRSLVFSCFFFPRSSK